MKARKKKQVTRLLVKKDRYAKLRAAAKRHKRHVVQDAASPVQMVRELFERAFKAKKLPAVWRIVSAMRGPDEGVVAKYDTKAQFTTPLRMVVLRKKHVDGGAAINVADWENYLLECADPSSVRRLGIIENDSHFWNHIRAAALAMQEE